MSESPVTPSESPVTPTPKKRSTLLTALMIIGGILTVLVVIGFIVGPRGARTPKAATVENSSWDGSVSQVERYLESTLKDPDSYEGIEWSPVSNLPKELEDGSIYVVRHKYRAKNSFGGYVVANQQFWINRQGTVVNVTEWQ